jgi:hypothetical protein
MWSRAASADDARRIEDDEVRLVIVDEKDLGAHGLP